ncbi:MalY/PatB family protein [Haloimpatiens sp. FM7315]|uniref:MalY/PatB family protein n=1 Tax=Haloimpatiens sp. FM7315 TaxID=3298609 RepID=UPI0035A2BB94
MLYNFDENVQRENTACAKWDMLNTLYGRDDLISMWVADMDFKVAPPIINAIKTRLSHEIFGYSFAKDSYYDSVINWMKKRHNWEIKKEWIKFTPGVVPAINYIVQAFTNPGDEIMIQSPVYYPFSNAIRNNGRSIVDNPLIYKNNTYVMDYEDLEKKITKRTKLLILCNPHNPVGRVWSKDELKKLGEICLKHNVLVVSDEIHFDLIYKGNKHTVFSSISEEFSQNSIVCTAPSKTFNIAGLQISNIIIANKLLREKFEIQLENNSISSPNIFAPIALEAAYTEGEPWLLELLDYLQENLEYLMDFFEKRIPKLKVIKPEGTYLIWIDCSNLNMTGEELREFFINKCKLALDDGFIFGKAGDSFERINIACPRALLKKALEGIEKAVNNL